MFSLARTRARSLLEHLGPDSDVALVLASEGTSAPVAEPSSDRARLLAALDAATCSARRADFAGAVREVLYAMAIIMAVAAFVTLCGLRRGVQEDTADAATAGTLDLRQEPQHR